MKIQTNSWHYKLIDNFSDDVPRNLCPYIRRLMRYLSGIIFVALFLGANCWLIGSIPISAFTALTGFVGFLAALSLGVVMLAVAFGVIGAIVFGIAYLVETSKEKLKQRRFERLKNGIPEKEPTLMGAWIKSKHDKMCPRLEFEGE